MAYFYYRPSDILTVGDQYFNNAFLCQVSQQKVTVSILPLFQKVVIQKFDKS